MKNPPIQFAENAAIFDLRRALEHWPETLRLEVYGPAAHVIRKATDETVTRIAIGGGEEQSHGEPLRLTVRFDPWKLSRNATQGKQPGHVGSLIEESKARAVEAWLEAGFYRDSKPVSPVPVRVSLLVRRLRTTDDSSIWEGIKWVRDQLFNTNQNGFGVTPDDSPKWFRQGDICWDTGKSWRGREEIVLVIEEDVR